MSVVGFPNELRNEVDMVLPESVYSYPVRVVPSNVSQVQSTTTTLSVSAAGQQLNGSSTNIIFDLPCNQGKEVYIDHRFSTLSFRVNYEIVNTPSAAIISSMNLRSHAWAHFDRITHTSSSGAIIDDVTMSGIVCDTLLQLSIDAPQRDVLAKPYGLQYENQSTSSLNLNQGHSITPLVGTLNAASSNYYSYCVPLFSSLIGQQANKFFNIGAVPKLTYTLQSAAILPLTISTSTATTAATFRCTIDNIQLNLQYISLGESVKLLNKPQIQYYNGITYRCSSNLIPAGSSANISVLTNVRGNSVRALFTRFTEASTVSTAGCVNYIYDSKALPATSIAYNINGQLVPSNPTDILHNPSLVFMQTQEANSNFNNYEFKSGLVPSMYFRYLANAGLPADTDYVFTESGSSSIATAQSQFIFAYSLEKISKGGIMDGLQLNSGNVFLQAVIASAITNSTTCYFISKQDIVYVLDTSTGELTSRT